MKALGQGLSFALDRFEVSLALEAEPRLLRVDPEAGPLSRWSLSAWQPEDGHRAALVVESRGRLPPAELQSRQLERETRHPRSKQAVELGREAFHEQLVPHAPVVGLDVLVEGLGEQAGMIASGPDGQAHVPQILDERAELVGEKAAMGPGGLEEYERPRIGLRAVAVLARVWR